MAFRYSVVGFVWGFFFMVTLQGCNQVVLLHFVLSTCLKLSLLRTITNKLQGAVSRKHVS